MIYLLTIFSPLFGFLLAGVLGQKYSARFSQIVTCTFMLFSVIGAISIFNEVALGGVTIDIPLMQWIEVGDFRAQWGLRFDTLSAIMVMIVALISFLVHIYSIGYMRHDPIF